MKLSATVRITDHTGGALLLDVKAGKFLSVDPVGALIIGFLRDGLDIASIATRLSKTFPDVAEDTLRSDLTAFIATLAEFNVVLLGASGKATRE